MDPQAKRKRLLWLRNMPPMFSLMLVVAFGILFYKIVQEFDLSAIHFSHLLSILSPFIIGLVISFFLVPPVKFTQRQFLRLPWMQQHPKSARLLSILLCYAIIFGLLILVLVFIVPQIFSGLSTLITLLIDSIRYLSSNLDTFIQRWDQSSWGNLIAAQDLSKFLEHMLSTLTIDLQNIASTVLPMLYQMIARIASGSINTIVGVIISIYLVGDLENAALGGKRLLYALLKQENADRIVNLSRETLTIFRRFFVGKALDSLIIGILCYILMRIFRLPYPELISVIVGLTNVIPYFGPFIGAIPSILIILMVSPMEAFIFAILILVLQQLDGNVIGPAILGNSLGLKPIWIIFSVTVGGGLFGIIGMIVGVPAFTVIYTLIRRSVDHHLQAKNIDIAPSSPKPTPAESAAAAPSDEEDISDEKPIQ